jgi:hypothetical protein
MFKVGTFICIGMIVYHCVRQGFEPGFFILFLDFKRSKSGKELQCEAR